MGNLFSIFRRGNAGLKSLVRHVRHRERELANFDQLKFSDKARELFESSIKANSNGEDFSVASLIERLAFGAEAVFRIQRFRLHDVQLMAIAASSFGKAVEMQTGEGKTLVAGITAYVRSLDGKGVHVATTNDYLAARDEEELAPIYELLGIRSAMLPAENSLLQKRAAYDAEVTYGPGYQFGFDYLHDQLTLREHSPNGLGQTTLREINGIDLKTLLGQNREHFFTVVDEADSVLIDEAVTPLVISAGPVDEKDATPYLRAARFANELNEGKEFELQENGRRIELTDAGRIRIHEELQKNRKGMQIVRPWPEYIENALKAKHLFQRNEHYVVANDEVLIVDQNTGRIHPDRHWQGGLHQAVEAKESVPVQLRPSSIARITRQRYYGKYDRIAGMSGTMMNVQSEILSVYGMPTVKIPTNVPTRRKILRNRFFASWDAKLKAIANDCEKRNATGQPILIGTRTIRESTRVSEVLSARGLDVIVLNGIQDQEEAEIVAAAGRFGAITIATNMAGRGTDIKPCDRALQAGGLHVIGTEPNDSQRIDRQLIGRSARQGDLGSAQFFISAEDDLIESIAPEFGQQIVAASKRDGESKTDFSRSIKKLQKEKEETAFEARKALVAADNWMDLVRESVVKE